MTSNKGDITNMIKTLKTRKVGGNKQFIIQHGVYRPPNGLAGVVIFDTAFASSPNVICNIRSTDITNIFSVNINNITKSGFSYRVRKYPNSSGGVGGTRTPFYYRAIGEKVV